MKSRRRRERRAPEEVASDEWRVARKAKIKINAEDAEGSAQRARRRPGELKTKKRLQKSRSSRLRDKKRAEGLMEERLQKIIARAGIASRRHAEQLILSGQVRVNGKVVTELGTKADPAKDKIEAGGRTVKEEEGHVYLLLHKPPEVVSALADPEGRRTLRNFLRGFPQRVYPVGNLEYTSSGLVFLTNDGDLAAALLKKWDEIEQVVYIKVKGKLTLDDLHRLGREAGVRMNTIRQPDATRGRGANFWYEVRMKAAKREGLKRVLMKGSHPIEKFKRIGLGPLTIEGVPQGRYRVMETGEVGTLRKTVAQGEKITRRRGER